MTHSWNFRCTGWRRLAVVLAAVALALPAPGAAEDQAGGSDDDDAQPRAASTAFPDVATGARVTQRFEIYNPHSRQQLQAVREMGFTQVILDWPHLHADASQLGLDVVMANWWTQESKPEEIEKGVEAARRVDRRRLVAVSMMDEPERYAPQTPFSYYRNLYRDLRTRFDKELPGVKLEISHWGPTPQWTGAFYDEFVPLYQAADRIRLMPYPDLDEGPLNEVYYQMLRSRRLMQRAERDLPQVVILQTWVLPERPKLPTIDELRVMAYQAMLAGADTLSFYNYDPQVWNQTAGFHDGFADLMRELTQFSRRHRRATVASRMSPHGVLTATVRPPRGAPLTVVVNTNRSEVDGLAALAVVVREAEVKSAVQADARVARRRPAARGRPLRRRANNCIRRSRAPARIFH